MSSKGLENILIKTSVAFLAVAASAMMYQGILTTTLREKIQDRNNRLSSIVMQIADNFYNTFSLSTTANACDADCKTLLKETGSKDVLELQIKNVNTMIHSWHLEAAAKKMQNIVMNNPFNERAIGALFHTYEATGRYDFMPDFMNNYLEKNGKKLQKNPHAKQFVINYLEHLTETFTEGPTKLKLFKMLDSQYLNNVGYALPDKDLEKRCQERFVKETKSALAKQFAVQKDGDGEEKLTGNLFEGESVDDYAFLFNGLKAPKDYMFAFRHAKENEFLLDYLSQDVSVEWLINQNTDRLEVIRKLVDKFSGKLADESAEDSDHAVMGWYDRKGSLEQKIALVRNLITKNKAAFEKDREEAVATNECCSYASFIASSMYNVEINTLRYSVSASDRISFLEIAKELDPDHEGIQHNLGAAYAEMASHSLSKLSIEDYIDFRKKAIDAYNRSISSGGAEFVQEQRGDEPSYTPVVGFWVYELPNYTNYGWSVLEEESGIKIPEAIKTNQDIKALYKRLIAADPAGAEAWKEKLDEVSGEIGKLSQTGTIEDLREAIAQTQANELRSHAGQIFWK